MDYKSKYLKYKNKYESLKSQIGGQPKIVKKSSDQNDDKNIYIDQIKPYTDLFYSYLNHDNDQIVEYYLNQIRLHSHTKATEMN